MISRSILEVLVDKRNVELVKQGMKKMVGAETYVSLDRIRELEFVSPGVNIQEKAETRAAYTYVRSYGCSEYAGMHSKGSKKQEQHVYHTDHC